MIELPPPFNSPTVRAIVAGILIDRAFDRCPVLADAIEDAGGMLPELANLRSADIEVVKRSYFRVLGGLTKATQEAELPPPSRNEVAAFVRRTMEQMRGEDHQRQRAEHERLTRRFADEIARRQDRAFGYTESAEAEEMYRIRLSGAFTRTPMPDRTEGPPLPLPPPRNPTPGHAYSMANSWSDDFGMLSPPMLTYGAPDPGAFISSPRSTFFGQEFPYTGLQYLNEAVAIRYATQQAFIISPEQYETLRADPLTANPAVRRELEERRHDGTAPAEG